MTEKTQSFGMVDGRPLFLDLEADSYFLLDADAEATFLTNDAHRTLKAYAQAPVRSILDQPGPSQAPEVRDLIAVMRAILRARSSVRRQPFARLVQSLTSSCEGDPSQRQSACALARRFARARRWITFEPHCLHDSIALLAFLRNNGSAAALVFGAKLDPFAAHCWVQAGDVLLNDRLDRIARFTTVLCAGQ